LATLADGVVGLRIAVADGYFDTAGMDEAAEAVAAVADALGARQTALIEGAAEARAAAFLITNAESAALHVQRLRSRAQDFDPDTRDRFLAGALLPASWVIQAQRVRRWFHDSMMGVFRKTDLIIAPATPCSAPRTGQAMMEVRGEQVPVRPNLGIFTQPISCVGVPVVSVPIFSNALPIGVQLIGPPWREDLCLRAAYALEAAGIAVSRPPAQ
jgi:1-carboxybiuret hydrolase